MSKYLMQQLSLPENHPNYEKARYILKNRKSLLDFDCWVHICELLGFDISYEDYMRVDAGFDGDLLELGKSDIAEILEILDDRPQSQKIWTVSIKDREDAEMDIWTTSFSTEKAADAFKKSAEEKLKSHGVLNTVDVIKDCGFIDDEGYLDWIDDRYSDKKEGIL